MECSRMECSRMMTAMADWFPRPSLLLGTAQATGGAVDSLAPNHPLYRA